MSRKFPLPYFMSKLLKIFMSNKNSSSKFIASISVQKKTLFFNPLQMFTTPTQLSSVLTKNFK